MPRYAFDIVTNEGRRVDDTEGVVLPNDEDAHVYAVQIVEELKRDDSMEWMGWSLELRQGERVVALLPFYKAH